MTKWIYVVRENDEYELPVLVTESPVEAAAFLGITVNGLHVHFCKGLSSPIRKSHYTVERIDEADLWSC